MGERGPDGRTEAAPQQQASSGLQRTELADPDADPDLLYKFSVYLMCKFWGFQLGLGGGGQLSFTFCIV